MAETTARDAKLIQYLNEAYGKEKQLETVLQLQIKLAKSLDKKTIHKRLQDHLKETKAQARGLERRIKQLGGKAEASNLPLPAAAAGAADAVTAAANKAIAAAKGPVQALRGTSPQDNLLRNLRDAFWNEAEEIAHYNVIEAVAEQLGDKETVKLAKEFRRQEERMQAFVSKQLAGVTKDVIKAEVPKEERAAASGTSSRSRSTSSRSSSSRRASGSRSRSASSGSSSRSSGSSSRKSSGGSTRKSSGGSTRKASGGAARKSSSSSSRSSGGSSRRSSGGSSSRRSSGGSSSS
jgi:ferritin-like metal-binding protein YciE